MKQLDMFGGEIDAEALVEQDHRRKSAVRHKYETMQDIYGVLPEKLCKTCKYLTTSGYTGFYKCGLWISSGGTTDIGLKDAACKKYVERGEK